MSYQTFSKGAAPGTPAAGKTTIGVNADGTVQATDAGGFTATLTNDEISNIVRNSGFWFAQRQAPGTATTYSSTTGRAISADGWGITNENASATYQRTDTTVAVEVGIATRNYGNFLKITATGKLVVSQVIESVEVMQTRGKTVRLQVYMKQLVGAAPVVNIGLLQLTAAGTTDTMPATFVSAFGANGVNPTFGTNLALIAPKTGSSADNGTIVGSIVQCTLSSAWQRFGAVFDVPTDCKNLVVVVFGNNQFAATNGFALTQVSLVEGAAIQDWNPMPYPLELIRCQRFYQKSFLVDTAPAQNVGVNGGESRTIAGKAGAVASAGFISWQYPVPLRATPTTLTLYNPAAANALARNITGAADMGTTTTTGSTANAAYAAITGVAATAVGDLIALNWSSDAEL